MTENVDLTGRKPGEEILLQMRSHPMTLIDFLGKLLVFVVAVVALVAWGTSSLILATIVILVGLAAVFTAWEDWYCWVKSITIVSNQRVVGVRQKKLFHRVVAETALDKIQNVTIETKGIRQTLFSYGDVLIQTAGANDEAKIRLEDLPNPYEVQKIIVKAARKD